ncbi:MAG: hypothetical protein LBQ02_04885 [Candidatus Nomurabacteria bacterium]|jgi:cobalamin biosynthesis protein CobD/CbiB|nr:hypothetical protein [Candidatus Nomurabacteria bacterium]
MKQEILKHQIAAEKAIAELSGRELEKFARYHEAMVKNFQHERAIHLAVTLFFAGILLLFFFVTVLFHIFVPIESDAGTLISISLSTIVVILLVTTIFYVRHYYQLENGVQRLYTISKEIYTHLK